jgi:hypothetical protein
LADGGVEELEALVFKRASSSASRLSKSACEHPARCNHGNPKHPCRHTTKTDLEQLRQFRKKSVNGYH